MVMEVPPAPHSVGREFVRQYYTLLNQAPSHLHRFYNNNSSFVHGGLDSPQRPEAKVVVGQKQIHQKIQQLNFRDCHAKISQVDSQATLGDGVVVQVTGELSNSGQPMRRFTQTFVLACQTPKKFYVHNDIFRYQDMLFGDEETDEGLRSDTEEDGRATEHSVIQAPLPTQHAYYNNTSAAVNNVAPAVQQVLVPAAVAPHMVPQAVQQPMSVVNGAAHPDEVSQLAQVLPPSVVPQPVLAAPLPPAPVQQQHPEEEEEEQPEEEAPQQEEQEEVPQEEAAREEVQLEEKPEPRPQRQYVAPVSTEPKTYATLVKSGGPISFASAAGGSSAPPTSAAPAKPAEYSPPAPDLPPGGGPRGGGPRPGRGGNVRGVGRTERDGRQQQPRQSFNEDRDNNTDGLDRDRRRGQGGGVGSVGGGGPGGAQTYPDNHQLFLGNLPHHATEDDLKELFRKYGSIIDLRIHSKPQSKGMAGNPRVPNYGFVIFDTSAAVQDVLSARPIYFPEGDVNNGSKLNVEEKKTRPRHSLDGRSDNPRMSDNPRSMDNPRSGGDPSGRGGNSMGTARGGGGMRGGPMTHRGGGGPRGGFSRGGGGGGGGGPMRGGGGGGTGTTGGGSYQGRR